MNTNARWIDGMPEARHGASRVSRRAAGACFRRGEMWNPYRRLRMRRATVRLGTAGGLSLLFLWAGTGCQALAAGAYVMGIGSTRKVEARYEIPDGPVVILVDDFLDGVQPPLAKDVLHDQLIEELRAHHAANGPITTREELARIRQRVQDFDKKTIREVGRLAAADTMIWIKPTVYDVYDNLEMAHSDGRFVVVVKVFDVNAEDVRHLRLWPNHRDGHQVSVTMNIHDLRASKSKAEVHLAIGAVMAEEVAKLFYTHKVDR